MDTRRADQVPVGRETLGRIFNVVGDPVDERGPLRSRAAACPCMPGPGLRRANTTAELFETGIKVIDLLAPYVKGGKIGLFGGAGVGKTVSSWSSSTTWPRATAASRSSPAWASAPAKATTSGTR